MKKIKVTISKAGKIFAETDGYKGPSCVKEISNLLEEFVNEDSIERTGDFYEKDSYAESYVEEKI